MSSTLNQKALLKPLSSQPFVLGMDVGSPAVPRLSKRMDMPKACCSSGVCGAGGVRCTTHILTRRVEAQSSTTRIQFFPKSGTSAPSPNHSFHDRGSYSSRLDGFSPDRVSLLRRCNAAPKPKPRSHGTHSCAQLKRRNPRTHAVKQSAFVQSRANCGSEGECFKKLLPAGFGTLLLLLQQFRHFARSRITLCLADEHLKGSFICWAIHRRKCMALVLIHPTVATTARLSRLLIDVQLWQRWGQCGSAQSF